MSKDHNFMKWNSSSFVRLGRFQQTSQQKVAKVVVILMIRAAFYSRLPDELWMQHFVRPGGSSIFDILSFLVPQIALTRIQFIIVEVSSLAAHSLLIIQLKVRQLFGILQVLMVDISVLVSDMILPQHHCILWILSVQLEVGSHSSVSSSTSLDIPLDLAQVIDTWPI